MTALRNRRSLTKRIGVLAMSVGVITSAAMSAPPASADAVSDAFLAALNNAGVGYGDPANAVQLGQSICPLLAQPGGSVAGAASNIANKGISPDMASLFTNIAISMYCPAMVASVANGDWLNNSPSLSDGGNLPGLPFTIPGLPGQ